MLILTTKQPSHRLKVYLCTEPRQTSPHSHFLRHTSTTLEYSVHFCTHTGNTWSSLGPQWEQLQNVEPKLASDTAASTSRYSLTFQKNKQESKSDVCASIIYSICVAVYRTWFNDELQVCCVLLFYNQLLHESFLLTTVGLIRVIPTVVHAVALPLQAHTHSVGTLEGVGITHFAKLGRGG